jgi:hypothetical protein
MNDAVDPRLVAAVRAIIADVRKGITDAVVEARGVERLMAISYIAGDERPVERYRRENASALLEMAAFRGNTRDAAIKIAERRTSDPHTQEILAQRFRRLRRTKK